MYILSGDLIFIKIVLIFLINVIFDNFRNINNKGFLKKMYKFIDFLENFVSLLLVLECIWNKMFKVYKGFFKY